MTQQFIPKYDDLEYLPEGLFLLKGKPFSGVAIDYYEDGVKWGEVVFRDGREHGMARAWHPNGQLKIEIPYVEGRKHGIEHHWFEDGSLHRKVLLEFGVMMKREVYDRSGQIADVFERLPSDVLYQNVLRWRSEAEPPQ